MNAKKRPVFLDLTKMKFPPTAIISIMHRMSGVLIFLLLPFALYLLHHSLVSQDSFNALTASLSTPFMSFLAWVLVSAASFHLFAGIRHMLMDCGVGEHMCAARMSAYLIIGLEIFAMFIAGVWIWG